MKTLKADHIWVWKEKGFSLTGVPKGLYGPLGSWMIGSAGSQHWGHTVIPQGVLGPTSRKSAAMSLGADQTCPGRNLSLGVEANILKLLGKPPR